MVSFSYPRREFLQLLRQLKSPITVRRNDVYFMRCELIATPTKEIFKLPGNEVYLNIVPIGCCKTVFYFKDFCDAMRKMDVSDVSIIVDAKTIKVNAVTLTAKTDLLTKKAAKEQKELPMDFLNEDMHDLFTQRTIKSKDYKLKDNSRTFSAYEVSLDVEHVYTRLKKYNIDYHLVDQFIRGNLKRV